MTKPVVTTPRADLQILALDTWWRAHRDKAPDLFEQELADAFRMLSAAPGVGKRYPFSGAAVLRVLLRSTRNHVYYVEELDRVVGRSEARRPGPLRSVNRAPAGAAAFATWAKPLVTRVCGRRAALSQWRSI